MKKLLFLNKYGQDSSHKIVGNKFKRCHTSQQQRYYIQMAGKQAKILSDDQVERLLLFASTTRNPIRNRVLVLLSLKAGLRAGEIANLTWPMVLDPAGDIAA